MGPTVASVPLLSPQPSWKGSRLQRVCKPTRQGLCLG